MYLIIKNILKIVIIRTFFVSLKKFIPNITARTIHRITLLSLVGPLYAFFLISKALGKVLLKDIDDEEEEKTKGNTNFENMSRREFFLFFKPKLT